MRKFTLRRALLSSAFSASVLAVGLLSGCGGGSLGGGDDLGGTRADISFSNTSSTIADTSDINVSGSEPIVGENTTGVHAAFALPEEFEEYHILILDREEGLSRTLRLEVFTDSPRNPAEGNFLDVDSDIFLSYVERNGMTRFWDGVSGRVTIAEVTSRAYRLVLDDVVFQSSTTTGDTFTVDGTVVIEKNDITGEPDDTYHSHEDGFVELDSVRKSSPQTHSENETSKW